MDRITILKRENIIWIIYVIFAIYGIKANNLEIKDLENNNNNNYRKYKNINIVIIIISILIYIYFVNITYSYYKQEHTKARILTFIASFLILIAGILFLITELISDDDVPNI